MMNIKSNNEVVQIAPTEPNMFLILFISMSIWLIVFFLAWGFVISSFDSSTWTIGSKVAYLITASIFGGISTGVYVEEASAKFEKFEKRNRNNGY